MVENDENNKFNFNYKELSQIRKKQKLSQEDLAEKIGVSRQSIHLWENGKIVPDIMNIVNLCNALNIPTNHLISGLKMDIEKQNKKEKIIKNMFNIVGIVVIGFFILFLGNSIRKSIILVKIANKEKVYTNIEEYYYKEEYFDASMKDRIPQNYYVYELWSDGDMIIKKYKDIDNESTTIEDYVNQKIYVINEREKEYSEDLLPVEVMNHKLPVGFSEKAVIGTNSILINSICGFNPFLRVKCTDNMYVISWNLKNNNQMEKRIEKINKQTGLVEEKQLYINDEKYEVRKYTIETNFDNQIISIPNVEEYKKK